MNNAMKTIIDIQIAPTERAVVTPCELLEDFADSTPAWQFLEEESSFYALLKGVPACILRYACSAPHHFYDFAFSSSEAREDSVMRLVLVDAERSAGLTFEQRCGVVSQLAGALRAYFDRRDLHASVRVVEEDMTPTAA